MPLVLRAGLLPIGKRMGKILNPLSLRERLDGLTRLIVYAWARDYLVVGSQNLCCDAGYAVKGMGCGYVEYAVWRCGIALMLVSCSVWKYEPPASFDMVLWVCGVGFAGNLVKMPAITFATT
jgi:hypothetical protein